MISKHLPPFHHNEAIIVQSNNPETGHCITYISLEALFFEK
jgi:hypothetical protein